MNEVELKLDVAEAAVEAIVSSALLRGASKSIDLRAVYYDTPAHALADADLSLRIRSSDGKRIQTVKAGAGAGAGLFVRSEWEGRIEGAAPVLDETTPARALLDGQAAIIGPVFEVNVDRRTWLLRRDDAVIEVTLDRGEVKTGGRKQPLLEIELELKTGATATVFELARELDTLAPVRLGVLTKAERGYSLAKPALTVFKAERLDLNRAGSAQDAFQHIARACIRQFRMNETVLLGVREADALHQARVALRRLRSAFSIFESLIEKDEQGETIRGEVRWLAAEFGEARDLDVLLQRSGPGSFHEVVRAARETAYLRVEGVLASRRSRALMLDLAGWLVDGEWLRTTKTEERRFVEARDFAGAALERLRKRVKKDGRNLATADDEDRHEVRKDAKKLRYASEFFVGLFDDKGQSRRHRRFVAALEELQDQLGALNDLATAPGVIRKLGFEDDPEAKGILAAGKREALIVSAAEAHDAFVDAKRFWR